MKSAIFSLLFFLSAKCEEVHPLHSALQLINQHHLKKREYPVSSKYPLFMTYWKMDRLGWDDRTVALLQLKIQYAAPKYPTWSNWAIAEEDHIADSSHLTC